MVPDGFSIALYALKDHPELFAIAYKHTVCAVTYTDTVCAIADIGAMNDLARTPRQIGTIIQRARRKRNWTQMQLAERAGLRQATIWLIGSGERSAKLESSLGAFDLEFRSCDRTKGQETDIEDLFCWDGGQTTRLCACIRIIRPQQWKGNLRMRHQGPAGGFCIYNSNMVRRTSI